MRPLSSVLALSAALTLAGASCHRSAGPRPPAPAPIDKVEPARDGFAAFENSRAVDDALDLSTASIDLETPRQRTEVAAPAAAEWPESRADIAPPGPENTVANDAGPLVIHSVAHAPERLTDRDAVTVEARIVSTEALAAATLHYDDGRGEQSVPLEAAGEAAAAPDEQGRRYAARIGPFRTGTLVTYWLTARDGLGADGRFPPAGSPTRSRGFYIEDPRLESELPVYHIFLDPQALAALDANPFSDTYQHGTFVFEGKVYCDVGLRYRGQTSRRYPKRQWKIRFNSDQSFTTPTPGHAAISSINLKSAYVDKIFMRETLGFDLFRDLGEPYCETWFIRTYLNGELLGLYLHVENPGGGYLKRNGLDEAGWLWKAYGEGHAEGRVASRRSGFRGSKDAALARPTRFGGIDRFELKAGDPTAGSALLAEFLTSINRLTGDALERYIREHMHVESFVNYLVACQLIHNVDHVMKNYLIYADSNGRFTYLPWDLDLTHGRNYECSRGGILNDVVRHDMWDADFGDDALLYGTMVHPKCDGFWNAVINAFLGRAKGFRTMYYERLAECLGRYYHPDVLVPKALRLRDQIRADVLLDRRRWGSYGGERGFDRRFERFLDWIPRRYDHLKERLEALGYEVARPLNAHFEAASRHGRAPLQVRFENLSAGDVRRSEWDFGDGTRSTTRAPEHTYTTPGHHDVTLTVHGPAGVHTSTRRAYVYVEGKGE